VNRVGVDGHRVHYAGESAIVDFAGETELELDSQANVATAPLSAEHLAEHRTRLPACRDADAFRIDV
jgi:predicted amidohydrolase